MKVMKMMKKNAGFLTAVMLLSLSLTGCGESKKEGAKAVPKIAIEKLEGEGSRLDKILEAGVITCATSPDFAPNEFQDLRSGEVKYVGSDIELAKYIADQLGVKLEIKAMDFESVKAAITMGQADIGISGFAYTEDRAKNMELSHFFNMEDKSGQGLLVLKKNADSLKTKEELKGKKIAAQSGSVQMEVTKEQLPDSECTPVTNINDAILMVKTGKVDAVALDIANAEMYASSYDDVVVSEFMFDYQNEGNVAAVMKGETKLMNAVNLIIDEVNEKGLYAEWRKEAIELAKTLGIEVDE